MVTSRKAPVVWAWLAVAATMPAWWPVHAAASAGAPQGAATGDRLDATRTFAPGFYARHRPRTALDMVLKTPGFKLQLGTSGRGLQGALGNVLINGVRPPSKSASVTDVLAAIPAEQVKAIMLVPAGAIEVDMGGHALLMSVVTATKAGIEGTVSAGANHNGPLATSGNAKAEMRINKARRLLTMNAQASGGRSLSQGRLVAPLVGQAAARASGGTRSRHRSGKTGAMAQWQLASGGDVQVRFSASQSGSESQPVRLDEAPLELHSTSVAASRAGDLSAEVQWPLPAEHGALSLSALLTRNSGQATSRLDTPDGSRESDTHSSKGEAAVRAAFRWKPSGEWSLQAGADHAANFLEGGLRYRIDGNEIEVPGAVSRVDEARSGVFASVGWQPRKAWHWEAALRQEASSITKQGHDRQGARFSDLLPRISATWQVGADSRLQGGSERQVGQLAFSQFLASVGLADDVVTAGARALAPETGWTHWLDYEHRIGERGLFNVRATRKAIDNPIDMVVLDNGLQAMANAAPAVIETVEAQLSAPLERIGLPGGLLSLSKSGGWRQSLDAVTGEALPGAMPGNASLSLRQELPSGKGAWGISLVDATDTLQHAVRQVTRMQAAASGSVFGQWRPSDAVLVRIGYSTGRKSQRMSWLFDAPRAIGAEPGLVYSETSSTPPAWDARLEWDASRDHRLEVGLTTASSTRYVSHTLSASGEAIEHSSLVGQPSISTQLHWRW